MQCLCSDYAHIYTDECGAPEKHTGCKLIPLPHRDGKITLESVRHAYHGIGDQHHVQARVISITQASEMGTVYQPEEIQALARFAHERGMFLHMDGARIANAAASLRQTLRQATRDLGVDVLSFGGTKNGIMGGEAVVFFNRAFSADFLYLRKQGMQLASKMRFIAAQFEALLRTICGNVAPSMPTAWRGYSKLRYGRFLRCTWSGRWRPTACSRRFRSTRSRRSRSSTSFIPGSKRRASCGGCARLIRPKAM